MHQLLGQAPKFEVRTTKSVRCTSKECGEVENVGATSTGLTIGVAEYTDIQSTMDMYISEPHRNRHVCSSGCRIIRKKG